MFFFFVTLKKGSHSFLLSARYHPLATPPPPRLFGKRGFIGVGGHFGLFRACLCTLAVPEVSLVLPFGLSLSPRYITPLRRRYFILFYFITVVTHRSAFVVANGCISIYRYICCFSRDKEEGCVALLRPMARCWTASFLV